ncbi:MAG TPA: molecular chaperone TorD family protein, partial [Campylobacterales bacterium]|nr:molecular chaperone TorD family protein [Campylobacterales bacterium]
SLYVNGALKKDYESIVAALQIISNEPFADEAKDVADAMLKALTEAKEGVLTEFEVLFNLPFGDFINSSASYYFDEREFGEQTIETKEIMCEAGYVKADFFSSGEDEFGFLCALSAKLLKDGKPELQKRVFEKILFPLAGGFLKAQADSERAEFYKDAAKLFALFLAFEKSYFELY